MASVGSRFLPAATSTPAHVSVDPSLTRRFYTRSNLDRSHGSARSRRKRERLPQHRIETRTEVLVAADRNMRSINMSNPNNNNNNNNNNAISNSNAKGKKRRNVSRLIAAEIRYLQRTTDPLLRRASFARVVRSIAQRMDFENALEIRWQATALDCLQEAAEAFIVDFFSFAARAAAHAHRVTVMLADIHFISQFYHMLRH
uniref:Centromere specific histone H3 CENP A n=1 Tax=Echinococcus granulosus TaxID=6210 RepID=A0A068WYQ1_ECHGR|nr:centromere specific histone H3 CENP A [Echinococcus granulosus]